MKKELKRSLLASLPASRWPSKTTSISWVLTLPAVPSSCPTTRPSLTRPLLAFWKKKTLCSSARPTSMNLRWDLPLKILPIRSQRTLGTLLSLQAALQADQRQLLLHGFALSALEATPADRSASLRLFAASLDINQATEESLALV